jgi:hypothetical protein
MPPVDWSHKDQVLSAQYGLAWKAARQSMAAELSMSAEKERENMTYFLDSTYWIMQTRQFEGRSEKLDNTNHFHKHPGRWDIQSL